MVHHLHPGLSSRPGLRGDQSHHRCVPDGDHEGGLDG